VLVSLFFGFANNAQVGSNSKHHWSKKFNFTPADKEIRDIVYQAYHDFQIDKPVFAFKQEMRKSDEANGTMVTSMYHVPTSSDAYVIAYSPWEGSPEKIQIKRPFLLNQDLADTIGLSEDSYVRRDKPHPGAQKFAIYHELAHAKNGDLDEGSYVNESLESNLFMMKLINVIGAAACLLVAWKSNSAPKAKCMAIAGIGFITNALYKDTYYRGFLAMCRTKEFMADGLACRMLIYKNDPKPIVHWIMDMSFKRDYRSWEGKTDNPAENIGSTHPTDFERIELCFTILQQSGIVWTEQLYKEIEEELDEDEFKKEKLVYLNRMHQIFLMKQNRNLIPLSHQKEKFRKFIRASVLEGYTPAALYHQVVKWQKEIVFLNCRCSIDFFTKLQDFR
jgi:hypothetical protein